MSQLYTVVDKTFGSYLPPGSVSALYYGLLLATTIPSLLAVENIFITPLAESEEKERVLARILSGIVLVFVPVVFFFFRNSRGIVSILFERGMFRDVSVEMTASPPFNITFAHYPHGLFGGFLYGSTRYRNDSGICSSFPSRG